MRPGQNDVGVGGRDPFLDKDPQGNPLSFTRQHVSHQKIDPFDIVPENFDQPCTSGDCTQNARVAVDGAFKTPSLRELGHTAPYMHDGSKPTLAAVVKHYAGGVLRRASVAPNIKRDLSLTAGERADLIAFLRTLSSERPAGLEQAGRR